jgi:phosphate transport system permease protein
VKGFWKDGDPLVWTTGGALALCLLMVGGLLLLILASGLGFFWPARVERFTLDDGSRILGSVAQREPVPGRPG